MSGLRSLLHERPHDTFTGDSMVSIGLMQVMMQFIVRIRIGKTLYTYNVRRKSITENNINVGLPYTGQNMT